MYELDVEFSRNGREVDDVVKLLPDNEETIAGFCRKGDLEELVDVLVVEVSDLISSCKGEGNWLLQFFLVSQQLRWPHGLLT